MKKLLCICLSIILALNLTSDYVYANNTEPITIAVVGYGINMYDEHILSKLYVNRQEIPLNGIDDDNNGYVDDVCGWNYAKSTYDVFISDTYGYKVHESAIISDMLNQHTHLMYEDKNIKILPIVVYDDSCMYIPMNEILDYAESMGAKIVSISSTYHEMGDDVDLDTAFSNHPNLLIVKCAGNNGGLYQDHKDFQETHNNVIVVGALDENGDLWKYSNYGPGVDCFILGECDPLYNDHCKNYATMQGTSFAVPKIVSQCCLILRNSVIAPTPQQLKQVIIDYNHNKDADAEEINGQRNKKTLIISFR